MKKIIIILAATLVLMFAEYRYIMTNLYPYYSDDGYLCIEFCGQVDAYNIEP